MKIKPTPPNRPPQKKGRPQPKKAVDMARAEARSATKPWAHGQGEAPESPQSQRERVDEFVEKAGPGLERRGNEARDELTRSGTYISVPGTTGVPSTAANVGGMSGDLDSHGASVTVGLDRANEDQKANVGVSRAVLSVAGTRTEQAHSASVTASLMEGYGGLDVERTWATRDGAVRNVSGSIGVSRKSLYLGGGIGNAKVSASGLLTMSTDRAVSDLGPYAGNEESLKGTRKVELRRSFGGSAYFAGGLATIGIGGMLDLDKGREIVFRTHVGDPKAREVLFEEGGLVRYFKDKVRAGGLADDLLQMPDLAKPETLKLGDELVTSVSGAVSAGLALGGFGLRAGVNGLIQGVFDLGVRRLSANEVEVSVTPTHVNGVRVFLDTPTPIEAGLGKLSSRALAQSFVFDLSKPESAAAYREALTGKLPSGLAAMKPDDFDTERLPAVLRQEKLPEGVRRTYLERIGLTQTSAGAGFNFGPLQEISGLAGLSATRSEFTEKRVIADPQGSLRIDTRGVERKREVLLSGMESAGIYASTRELTSIADDGTPTRTFADVVLRARFTDDKLRGFEVNDEIIDKLNDAFGLHIAHTNRPGRKQSLEVNAELVLTREALEELANCPSSRLQAVQQRTGIAYDALLALQARLLSLPAGEQAGLVQEFVADHGLAGMGTIHQLLGDESPPLVIQTESSAYRAPVETAKTLAFKYPNPIQLADGQDAITRRFKEVTQAIGQSNEALTDLAQDELVTPEHQGALSTQLGEAAQTLDKLIAVGHLKADERKTLWDGLDAGWTTSTEYKLMNHLAQAGLA